MSEESEVMVSVKRQWQRKTKRSNAMRDPAGETGGGRGQTAECGPVCRVVWMGGTARFPPSPAQQRLRRETGAIIVR